ncbi:hypothetical protein [Vibrio campbellii]|uniref:hypothetical protein n=1 Tax=Vibrio campbellii TaxID=680 RepID=UPI0013156FFF|nr:hypothetical protein [Vibrio campbellii]
MDSVSEPSDFKSLKIRTSTGVYVMCKFDNSLTVGHDKTISESIDYAMVTFDPDLLKEVVVDVDLSFVSESIIKMLHKTHPATLKIT